jgi:peptidoglycan/LPS O-acetylase OafA/YrhL
MKENSSDRFLELDVLRGLAAFAVLCFHYTTRYAEIFSPTSPPLFRFPYGMYGVQLFFMISGFVIFMTLEKTKRPLDFIVSRFSRLYPCYWLAIILTFTVIRFIHLPGREASLTEASINFSMLQDWWRVKSVDSVYWTLPIELSFYFLMFLFFLTKNLKNVEIGGLAWLIFMVWSNRLLWLVHWHAPYWLRVSELLNYGHLFFAGILFYKLKTQGNVWYRHAGLALCLVVQYMLRTDIIHSIIVGVFFLIFYLFVLGKLKWAVNKPMVYLGTISYSGYLTHQYIGYIIIRYLYTLHANAYLRFIVPALCAILIATAITYGLERPAIFYIRQKYKIWKQRNLVKVQVSSREDDRGTPAVTSP